MIFGRKKELFFKKGLIKALKSNNIKVVNLSLGLLYCLKRQMYTSVGKRGDFIFLTLSCKRFNRMSDERRSNSAKNYKIYGQLDVYGF